MADDNQTQDDIQVSPMGAANSDQSADPASGDASASTAAAGSGATSSGTSAGTSTDEQKAPVKQKKKAFDLEEAAFEAASQTLSPQDSQNVPDLVKEKFPDLMGLINETESMNQEERDYWFQILPIMTEDQIAKFREILVSEKEQLSQLDKEYEEELTRLNEKHMIEWKEFESKEKREAIAGAEAQAEQDEKVAEEELLKRLTDI